MVAPGRRARAPSAGGARGDRRRRAAGRGDRHVRGHPESTRSGARPPRRAATHDVRRRRRRRRVTPPPRSRPSRTTASHRPSPPPSRSPARASRSRRGSARWPDVRPLDPPGEQHHTVCWVDDGFGVRPGSHTAHQLRPRSRVGARPARGAQQASAPVDPRDPARAAGQAGRRHRLPVARPRRLPLAPAHAGRRADLPGAARVRRAQGAARRHRVVGERAGTPTGSC